MIYGVGVDMTTISRIEKACSGERFLEKYFSEGEIQRYREDPARLAANFAAKEAFSKALGTGVRGFAMKEVSLFRDELGKPYYAFTGRAAEIVEEKGLICHVSVSDEKDTVIVFTVIEA